MFSPLQFLSYSNVIDRFAEYYDIKGLGLIWCKEVLFHLGGVSLWGIVTDFQNVISNLNSPQLCFETALFVAKRSSKPA